MELWRMNKEKSKARKCFLRNGNVFLKQLIADCNGTSNPIRMFSFHQISKATNQFDPKCSLNEDLYFIWYKGYIEGRPYAIKRHTERLYAREEMGYSDIVLSARVSNHNGFPKLIGCCLEYPLPLLVFEDLDYTVLNQRGSVGCEDGPLLPWNARLKIAKEVATAITYLHIAFPRIIIHRDIKTTNVVLDKNGTAKLTDLSSAVTLPEGKLWIEDEVIGTNGYLDPNYSMTKVVTEYTDVFSFGILMLVLLMGRPPLLQGSDRNFIGYVRDLHERGEAVEFGGGSNDMRPGQMKTFLDLALRCCERRSRDRPKMIVVAKEIKLIEQGSFDSEMMLENVRKRCFLKNDSILQQQLTSDCNDISNPKMFSFDQISKATSQFNPKCSLNEDLYFSWYKGDIEGRPYAIKRHTKKLYVKEEVAYNDIALSAQVSNHNGFLKLIGSCLGFPRPVLVFEDLDYRVLNQRGTVGCKDAPLLPWNVRLKIAKEVATAITYLHTAFPTIIIHRNIKATNVFLDKNGTAKLTDLSHAVTLPEGELSLQDVMVAGTVGYIDPDFNISGLVTEYTDVFSFGILMLVLLMGRPPYLDESDGNQVHDRKFIGYVRKQIEKGEAVEFGGDSNDMRPDQMKMFLDLALRCCVDRIEDRPKMILVAKEIKLIEQESLDCSEDGQT